MPRRAAPREPISRRTRGRAERARSTRGETEERIYFLNAFDDVEGVYTEKERAALALTEAVTVLTDGFVPDDVYAQAAKHFEERELAQLIALITTINGWNRMNVATRTPPMGR